MLHKFGVNVHICGVFIKRLSSSDISTHNASFVREWSISHVYRVDTCDKFSPNEPLVEIQL